MLQHLHTGNKKNYKEKFHDSWNTNLFHEMDTFSFSISSAKPFSNGSAIIVTLFLENMKNKKKRNQKENSNPKNKLRTAVLAKQ